MLFRSRAGRVYDDDQRPWRNGRLAAFADGSQSFRLQPIRRPVVRYDARLVSGLVHFRSVRIGGGRFVRVDIQI